MNFYPESCDYFRYWNFLYSSISYSWRLWISFRQIEFNRLRDLWLSWRKPRLPPGTAYFLQIEMRWDFLCFLFAILIPAKINFYSCAISDWELSSTMPCMNLFLLVIARTQNGSSKINFEDVSTNSFHTKGSILPLVILPLRLIADSSLTCRVFCRDALSLSLSLILLTCCLFKL